MPRRGIRGRPTAGRCICAARVGSVFRRAPRRTAVRTNDSWRLCCVPRRPLESVLTVTVNWPPQGPISRNSLPDSCASSVIFEYFAARDLRPNVGVVWNAGHYAAGRMLTSAPRGAMPLRVRVERPVRSHAPARRKACESPADGSLHCLRRA